MKIFGERLKQLRLANGLSAAKLGKILGVSDSTIIRWENATIISSVFSLKLVAEYFGVSADYLIGLED